MRLVAQLQLFSLSACAPSRLGTASAARIALPRLRMMCSSALPDYLQDMAEELEAGEAQLFDVREPDEWAHGRLQQALLVPLSELQNGVAPQYDRTKLTYLHCAAGVRVHYAAPLLEQMGYERVIPLQEGYATLANMGFRRAQ